MVDSFRSALLHSGSICDIVTNTFDLTVIEKYGDIIQMNDPGNMLKILYPGNTELWYFPQINIHYELSPCLLGYTCIVRLYMYLKSYLFFYIETENIYICKQRKETGG